MKALLTNVIRNEEGTATLEYAFVLGLITLGAMALISMFGTKVIAKWTSVNSKM